MSSPKCTITFLNDRNNAVATREYDPAKNSFSDVFEYADNLLPSLALRPVRYRITRNLPTPVEQAYEVYRNYIAEARAGKSNSFRPEWGELTIEVKQAFISAMREYVRKGGV